MFLWQIFVRDNIGKKFGRWTVVKYVGRDLVKKHRIECKCDCGVVKTLDVRNFINGKYSKSCLSCTKIKSTFGSFGPKQPKSIYTHPMKMHASEEEDIMDYYNDFSHKYYRDENN